MNPKIKKINAEYEKNAAKIEELQARQKELVRMRTDLENNDILELVHSHNMDLELLEEADENSEIDSAMLMLLLNMMFQNMTESEPQASFTPTGNLTLIDDILQTEVYATEDTELQEKQFITLQSKSGNYFYLVIDRTGDTENVYFMNLVLAFIASPMGLPMVAAWMIGKVQDLRCAILSW